MTGQRQARPAVGLLAVAGMTLVLAGCGGSAAEGLSDGVYASEAPGSVVLKNEFVPERASTVRGRHEILIAQGSFTDTWPAAVDGEDIVCTGTVAADGDRATFTYTSGCRGDWSATFETDGDTVSWSALEALPPHDGAADLRQVQAIAGSGWTRTGDAPGQG